MIEENSMKVDMNYVHGLIGDIADNDDLPDGAWWQMMEDTIEMDKSITDDANDVVHAYLDWKSKQANRSE